MHHPTLSHRSGFTLLELSIVLVIIGLIVGGITVGSSMIRAAELRGVITEQQRFTTALHTFRDKYFMLPGDMPNATEFWGEAHATAATCKTTISTGTETCDGDGNKQIGSPTGSMETLRSWQHLANAELIEGQYAGKGSTAYFLQAEAGVTTPTSKIPNATWNFVYSNNTAGSWSGSLFRQNYGNTFIFGAMVNNSWNYGGALSPEEAWNIDKKSDDGRPDTGNVVSNWSVCTTATANTDTNTDYSLTNKNLVCMLMMPTRL